MFELEKYTGAASRHTCPNCQTKRSFARYKDEGGEYLSFDVGRCNRESSCGFHQTPKIFFETNPQAIEKRGKSDNRRQAGNDKNTSQRIYSPKVSAGKPDYIDFEVFKRTLAGYEQNAFIQFLLSLFPENAEAVWQAVKNYFVGTTKDGKTIFWQIDRSGNVRTGKIIAYDAATGKRRKDVFPNWTHAELKRRGQIKADFNLMQCFFGEHLLRGEKQKPVAIVEAEKTAVIASICFPEFVWLAVGAKQNLKPEKLKRFGNRRIILYADADGFALWQEIALQARRKGFDVRMSSLIERHGTDAEKGKGFDLADYLISEQAAVNQHNLFVEKYNSALEKVLSDENLIRETTRIIDARKVAETDFDRIREIVLQIAEGQTRTFSGIG